MDVHRYIAEIAWPTVMEFDAGPTSVRRAFLACAATYHVIERLYPGGQHGNQRKRLREECHEFAIVDPVTHAFKHGKASHESAPDNLPLTDIMVVRRPPMFFDVSGYLDVSLLDDTAGRVMVSDDPRSDLGSVRNSSFTG